MQRSLRFLFFVECPSRWGGWASRFPHSILLRKKPRPWGGKSLLAAPFRPISSTLPIYNKSKPALTGGAGSVVSVVKMDRKSFSPERRVKSRIGRLVLFLLNLFSVRRGVISFAKLALPSLFLLFLAGQFFSPLFAFISSPVFWQCTLLHPGYIIIMKTKRIPIKFLDFSVWPAPSTPAAIPMQGQTFLP